jgi:hypothetical protein
MQTQKNKLTTEIYNLRFLGLNYNEIRSRRERERKKMSLCKQSSFWCAYTALSVVKKDSDGQMVISNSSIFKQRANGNQIVWTYY